MTDKDKAGVPEDVVESARLAMIEEDPFIMEMRSPNEQRALARAALFKHSDASSAKVPEEVIQRFVQEVGIRGITTHDWAIRKLTSIFEGYEFRPASAGTVAVPRRLTVVGVQEVHKNVPSLRHWQLYLARPDKLLTDITIKINDEDAARIKRLIAAHEGGKDD